MTDSAIYKIVALEQIHTVITILRIEYEMTIHTVFRIVRITAIIAILVSCGSEYQVTVFEISRTIRVDRVYHPVFAVVEGVGARNDTQ